MTSEYVVLRMVSPITSSSFKVQVLVCVLVYWYSYLRGVVSTETFAPERDHSWIFK
jgi:hypothetical protein